MRAGDKNAEGDPGVPALAGMLASDLAAAGLTVGAAEVDRLARFVSILLRASNELSLSTIRDPAEAVQRQVVEPLAGWHAIRGSIPPGPLVEVGSGGGAPGVPIAIVADDRAVTLVEARERRAGYLRDLVTELGLTNVTVVEERGEVFGGAGGRSGVADSGPGPGREQFAYAMSRALAKLPVAFELLLPLVQVGGLAVVYAGPSAQAALPETSRVVAALGGDAPELEAVSWPGAAVQLAMVSSRKSAPTAERFPRGIRRMRKGPPA